MSDCKYCVPGRTCPGCIARKIKALPAAPVERGTINGVKPLCAKCGGLAACWCPVERGEPDKVREALVWAFTQGMLDNLARKLGVPPKQSGEHPFALAERLADALRDYFKRIAEAQP